MNPNNQIDCDQEDNTRWVSQRSIIEDRLRRAVELLRDCENCTQQELYDEVLPLVLEFLAEIDGRDHQYQKPPDDDYDDKVRALLGYWKRSETGPGKVPDKVIACQIVSMANLVAAKSSMSQDSDQLKKLVGIVKLMLDEEMNLGGETWRRIAKELIEEIEAKK